MKNKNKNKKLKNWSVGIFHFTLANLSIGQNGLKRQTLKNQIESQFKVLTAIFLTKYISLFAND